MQCNDPQLVKVKAFLFVTLMIIHVLHQ